MADDAGATRRLNLEGVTATATPPPGFTSPDIRSPSRGGTYAMSNANAATARKLALPAPVANNPHQMKHFQQLKSEAQAWEQKYKTVARENIEKEAKIKEMQETISRLETSKAAAIKAKVEGEQSTMRHKSMETRNRELTERLEGMRVAAAEREEAMNRRVQDLEQAANKWKTYGEEAYRKVEEIRNAYTSLEQVYRAAQDDLNKLNKAHGEATKELRVAKDDLARTTHRANELTEVNAKLLAELHTADDAIKDVTAARQRDETHLFQMHEVEQKMRDRVADAQEQARKAEERFQETMANLEAEKRRSSQLEERVAAVQHALERCEDDKLQLAAKIEESNRDMQRLKMNIDTSSSSSKHLQVLIDQAKASEQATIAKFNQLSEEATERAKEFTQMKIEFNAAQVTIKLREHDMALLQAELVSARHETEMVKATVEAMRKETTEVAAEKESKLLSVDHERRVMEEQLLGLEQRIAMITSDNTRLKLEADQYKQLAEEAQRRAEEALNNAGTAVESVKEIVAARHKAETEGAKKAAALQEVENRLAQLQRCLNDTSDSLADNTTKLEAERAAKLQLEAQVADLQARLTLQTEACHHLGAAKEAASAAAAEAISTLKQELESAHASVAAEVASRAALLAQLNHVLIAEFGCADETSEDAIFETLRNAAASRRDATAAQEATAVKLRAALAELESARCNVDRLERCLAAASSDATTTGRRAMSLENQLHTITQRAAMDKGTLESELAKEHVRNEQLRKELMTARQQLVEGREDALARFDALQNQLRAKDEDLTRARSESTAATVKAKVMLSEVDGELEAERSRRISLEAALERSEAALVESKKLCSHEASRHKAYKDALETVKAKLAKSQDCRREEHERFHERFDRLVEQRDQGFREFEELAKNYKELALAFRTRGGNIDRDLGAEHSTRVSQCIVATERNKKAAAAQKMMLQENDEAKATTTAHVRGPRGDDTESTEGSQTAKEDAKAATFAASRESNVLGLVPSNARPERKSVSFDPRPARRIESGDRPDTELAPVLKRNRAEFPVADDRFAQ